MITVTAEAPIKTASPTASYLNSSDYSLPENLRIDSREHLIRVLKNRIAKDTGARFSISEAKTIVTGGLKGYRE